MRFKEEYKKAKSREDFVYMVSLNHKVSPTSALRRWYECKKVFTDKIPEDELYSKRPGKKYQAEFDEATDVQDFIRIMQTKYPNMSLRNARRRYYDYTPNGQGEEGERSHASQASPNVSDSDPAQGVYHYLEEEKIKPNCMKLMDFDDMIHGKFNMSRDFLRRYGFSEPEINWLIDNRRLDIK